MDTSSTPSTPSSDQFNSVRHRSIVISKQEKTADLTELQQQLEKSFKQIRLSQRDVKIEELLIRSPQEFMILHAFREKKRQQELDEVDEFLRAMKPAHGVFSKKK
jgi:hypothetical protein